MRVVLTGTYNSQNKGDAAMQISTRDALVERGHEVIIATPEPAVDGPLYGSSNLVEASRRSASRAPLNLVRALAQRVFKRQLIGDDAEITALADADLVVDLSGDMLTEDYGVAVALSHFHPLLLSWILNVPYVALAQSIGPFRYTSPLAAFLLRRAALVTCREPRTLEHLNKLGLGDVEVTADTAFTLVAQEFPGLPLQQKPYRIGISLSGLAEDHHQGRSLLDDVAQALSIVFDSVDAELLGIPHVTGPKASKDDRIVLEKLQARGLDIHVLDDVRPSEMKHAVSTCDILVGARMHANIAALGSGVPVVALAYSHKFWGIMSEFGQESFVLDLGQFDADQLANVITKLWEERETVAEEIRAKRVDVSARATRNFELVEELRL